MNAKDGARFEALGTRVRNLNARVKGLAAINRKLTVSVAILCGTVTGLVAAILTIVSGFPLVGVIGAGGVCFVTTVTMTLLVKDHLLK